MWTVIYGRHWVYLKYKEYRYETPWAVLAFFVHLWWHCRYSLSVYPVKYIKIYKVQNGVIKLSSFNKSEVGDYERLKRKSIKRRF